MTADRFFSIKNVQAKNAT